ncbi:hypothetical protein [Brachyspira catarrhinii]|uniref:Uncharacterized protein n=1 Tax=Brachyspira catarrhinii TaxID=2528966 RepID=A0ABY2TNB1_9SPIR|nr:hypothetical protein [Brachyspira catarrhinii]TKZ29731.1 hypothetical protein EZH24_10845 [Brachyspira catarrhinii]
MKSIEKLEEELKRIDKEVADKDITISNLRQRINDVEMLIFDLRNERANIKQELTKLKNMNRKKYGVLIVRKDYKEDIIEEFETLKECYDYIDKEIKNQKIQEIQIEINPERH